MSHILLYLDESGDLGFNWTKKKTARYFVMTILLCEDQFVYKALGKAVSKTIKNKIASHQRKKAGQELKGSKSSLEAKKYLLKHLPLEGWYLYSVILDKKVLTHLPSQVKASKKLYNHLTKILLDQIPFNENLQTINLIVDQCKNAKERQDFNYYLETHPKVNLPISSSLNITHEVSHKNTGIQLVDLFCWGIACKYNWNNYEWYDCYKEKIKVEYFICK